MSLNRVEVVENNLDEYLRSAPRPKHVLGGDDPVRPGSTLTARTAISIFEDQVISRQLDVQSRELKKRGESFYTIASAGHEQNAIIGAQLNVDDPCFLHYRSGALVMARARKADGQTAAFDSLLGICASTDEPIAGGRHKVWGSRELWIPPQTSTIASHLPKAVGTAFAMCRGRRIGVETEFDDSPDALVLCSFGDASANHATAMTGINSARYAYRHGNPTPVVFLCEDNRRGISVETPRRWIGDMFENMRYLHYFYAEGEMDEIWDRVELAIHTCRSAKAPVFLHLKCKRLWGHAGSDIETSYRNLEQIEYVESRDPVLLNARRLVELGAAEPATLSAIVADTRERLAAMAEEATRRPKLQSRAAVIEHLAPYDAKQCREIASWPADAVVRTETFGKRLPEDNDSAA
ncbi:MAG: 2-oxoisovalerate dehydrogenase E1 component, partial [Planctomycetota bacterium]